MILLRRNAGWTSDPQAHPELGPPLRAVHARGMDPEPHLWAPLDVSYSGRSSPLAGSYRHIPQAADGAYSDCTGIPGYTANPLARASMLNSRGHVLSFSVCSKGSTSSHGVFGCSA